MNRIDSLFARCRAENRAALILYITGGFPDLETTRRLLPVLEASGADLIEFGIPFSDPIADGLVIQDASTKALAAGMTLDKGLDVLADFRRVSQLPIVLFGAWNPFLRRGIPWLMQAAKRVDIDGFLVPDMPVEEAGPLTTACRAAGLHNVQFIAPTTPDDRMRTIAAAGTGFLYCFSLKGITGARAELDANLAPYMARVRAATSLPLAIGFGIATPEHVRQVRALGDGVVVGSALIRTIEQATKDGANVEQRVGDYVKSLAAELKRPAGASR